MLPARILQPSRDASAALYGGVLSTSFVVILSLDAELSPGRGAVELLDVMLTFYIAHVYIGALRAETRTGAVPDSSELRLVGAREAAMLLGCLPCMVTLLVCAAAGGGHDASFRYAAYVGVAGLFILGVNFGLRTGMGVVSAVASGAVDAILGVGVVALKVILVH